MVGRGGRDAADPGLATRGVVAELLAFVIAVDVSVLLQRRPGCDGVLALHDVTVICMGQGPGGVPEESAREGVRQESWCTHGSLVLKRGERGKGGSGSQNFVYQHRPTRFSRW